MHDNLTTQSDVLTANNFLIRDPDELLPEGAAATLLGVTPRALQAWRQRGGSPPFVRISARCILYRRKDLVAWAEARLRASTSDTSEHNEP